MKRLIFGILLLVAISQTFAQRKATTDTLAATSVNGKEFMVSYYQQTFDGLKKSITGLSAEQLQFKPAADKWSISQCLDHILLTEKALFDYAKQGMEKPANPERKKEVKVKDEELIKGMNDRSSKAKAPDNIIGKGTYNDPAKALADLQDSRTTILAYLNQFSIDDLRNRINDSFFGPVDAYHGFLYLAAHTSRHTAQIEEIKADPNFPKP
jgi:hypothetical protein